MFSFPTSPCPALSYANQQYLGKAKAILLYSHPQISTFLCMTSRLARDVKSVFSQHLPELKLKAPCCAPQAFFPTLHCGLCPPWGRKELLSLSEFHLSMLLHILTLMDKIATLENCSSLTAGDTFMLTLVLSFPDSCFTVWAWNREWGRCIKRRKNFLGWNFNSLWFCCVKTKEVERKGLLEPDQSLPKGKCLQCYPRCLKDWTCVFQCQKLAI